MLNALLMSPTVRTFAKRHLESTREISPREAARSGQHRNRQGCVQLRQRHVMHDTNLPRSQAADGTTGRRRFDGLQVNLQRLRDVVRTGSAVSPLDIVELG